MELGEFWYECEKGEVKEVGCCFGVEYCGEMVWIVEIDVL